MPKAAPGSCTVQDVAEQCTTGKESSDGKTGN